MHNCTFLWALHRGFHSLVALRELRNLFTSTWLILFSVRLSLYCLRAEALLKSFLCWGPVWTEYPPVKQTGEAVFSNTSLYDGVAKERETFTEGGNFCVLAAKWYRLIWYRLKARKGNELRCPENISRYFHIPNVIREAQSESSSELYTQLSEISSIFPVQLPVLVNWDNTRQQGVTLISQVSREFLKNICKILFVASHKK